MLDGTAVAVVSMYHRGLQKQVGTVMPTAHRR